MMESYWNNSREMQYWQIDVSLVDIELLHRKGVLAVSKFGKRAFPDLRISASPEEWNRIVEKMNPGRHLLEWGSAFVLHFRDLGSGDVFFLSANGTSCLGMLKVESGYEYVSGSGYPHRRKCRWLTDESFELEELEMPDRVRLFQPRCFSRAGIGKRLAAAYLKKYPMLEAEFPELAMDSAIDSEAEWDESEEPADEFFEAVRRKSGNDAELEAILEHWTSAVRSILGAPRR